MNDTEIKLDFERENRTGLTESVLCGSKSTAQLLSICEQVKGENKSMLFTRLTEDQFKEIDKKYPSLLDYDPVSRTAIQGEISLNDDDPQIAIVTGGTSDVPIAKEVMRTLNFYGHNVLEINDVGVAGIWRLQERLSDIEQKKVVICVAGMDAALPTVLGGLISSIIIAVPSSVGYGAVRGGETALNSLLCSCAPGLVVVNIDNGYGAACAAVRAMNQLK